VTVLLEGAAGRRIRLKAGDMLAIPAGVGHRRIGDDTGVKVIGAYPPGQSHYTMKRKGRPRANRPPLPRLFQDHDNTPVGSERLPFHPTRMFHYSVEIAWAE
jgi:uncharacterized protein YjlB